MKSVPIIEYPHTVSRTKYQSIQPPLNLPATIIMKLVLLLTTASFVQRARSSPVPCLNTTNITSLHARDVVDPIIDPFYTAVCRGTRLSWAMQLSSHEASQFLTPINSEFDGDLRDDLYHWGYTEVPVQGYLCDFDTTHHLETAFQDLGVDPRSERRGGSNQCFHVEHRYQDHPLPVREQFYWVNDKRYRVRLRFSLRAAQVISS